MNKKSTGKLWIIDNIKGKGLVSITSSALKSDRRLWQLLKGREIFCVAKDSNLDGLSGAALLMHNYGLKPENIIFTNYIHLKSLLGKLKKLRIRNSAIVFNDIGMSPGGLEYLNSVIKLLKSNNNTIIWLDDHPWDYKVIKSVRNGLDFAAFGENQRYCATELVYLLLCNRDRISKKIAMLAHYSDFVVKSRYDSLIEKLSYSIVYLSYGKEKKEERLSRVTKSISMLDFSNRLINRSYKLYIREEVKAKKALLRNSYTIKSNGYEIGLAFGNRLQTNSACAVMAGALHTDINIYVNIDTGKSGIRSRDYVDGSLIAKSLGGGGHPQASGFQVNPSKFRNYNKPGMKSFADKVGKISKRMYG